MGASRNHSPERLVPSKQWPTPGVTRGGAVGRAPSGGSFQRAHGDHPADPKLARRHNLPAPLTSFVGREPALDADRRVSRPLLIAVSALRLSAWPELFRGLWWLVLPRRDSGRPT